MRKWIVLAALIPGAAFATPKDGLYANTQGAAVQVSAASDTGFDFALVAGANGAAACPEGENETCLQINGHAEAAGKGFTYIDPDDDHSRVFFAETAAGLRVLSTTGDLGTGTANRAAMLALTGEYKPEAGSAGDQAAAPDASADATGADMTADDQSADASADGAADDGSTGEDEAMAEGIMDFQTPSANIGCEIINSDRYEVRCDMLKLNRSYVTAPTDCEEDWGDSFQVAEHDRKGSLLCHGDTVVYSNSEVLEYGKSVQFGGLTCISEKSGLTCQNAEGHGFTLSRKAQKVF